MVRPAALTRRPSLVLTTHGGGVATLLLSALLLLGPAFGIPAVDFPRLVGGVFTGDGTAAFWLGFWLFFLGGWIVFPMLFALFWPTLPGDDDVTFANGLRKGLTLGVLLWILSGILLPALGWLSRLDGMASPGPFALGEGVLAALGVLMGHLVYGAALGLISAMMRGISPLDVLGWYGYGDPPMNSSAVSGNR